MSEPRWLTRNVLVLSFTSLLNDAASEMVVPLLPFFLTSVLGVGPGALGLVEGTADTVASLLKLWSGKRVDKTKKCTPWILGGYGLAATVRPLLGFAQSAGFVGLIRALDRVGKGLRSAPRDVMLAASAPPSRRASVFSFHRAMDHGGAAVGSLLAWGALHYLQWDLRTIFLACVFPGILTLLLLGLGLKEEEALRPPPKETVIEDAPLSRRFQLFLAGIGLAGLGAGTESFLLLAAGGSQVPLEELPLLWLALHLIKSFSAAGSGPLADRLGHKTLVIAGRVIHTLVFLGFAVAASPALITALFLLHGLHQGLTEGAEKALVADMAPPNVRGKAYGAWNLVSGITALPASALFGFLWEEVSRPVAFEVAAGLSLLAILILSLVKKEPIPSNAS